MYGQGCVCVVLALVSCVAGLQSPHDELWEAWWLRHQHRYPRELAVTPVEHEDHVKRNFLNNMLEAGRLLERSDTADFGPTVFSGYSAEEFVQRFGGGVQVRRDGARSLDNGLSYVSHFAPVYNDSVVQDVKNAAAGCDWQTGGGLANGVVAVTRVKNQLSCGSCWSFGVTACVEGQQGVHNTSHAVSCSEQALLDCNIGTYGGNPCAGGDPVLALVQILKSWGGKLIPEISYPPYMAKQEECTMRTTSTYPNAVPIDDYALVVVQHPDVSGTGSPFSVCNRTPETPTRTNPADDGCTYADEDQLMVYVAKHGPVGVMVKTMPSLQHYTGGVLDVSPVDPALSRCEGGPGLPNNLPDHAMTLVGFGTDSDGTPYWKVKNTWGPKWGETGYVRLQRGTNQLNIVYEPYAAVRYN